MCCVCCGSSKRPPCLRHIRHSLCRFVSLCVCLCMCGAITSSAAVQEVGMHSWSCLQVCQMLSATCQQQFSSEWLNQQEWPSHQDPPSQALRKAWLKTLWKGPQVVGEAEKANRLPLWPWWACWTSMKETPRPSSPHRGHCKHASRHLSWFQEQAEGVWRQWKSGVSKWNVARMQFFFWLT